MGLSDGVLVVTGTDTEVGKTVVTAALAALALAAGRRVAVLKPAQTGIGADEPGDLAEVVRLVGPSDRLTTVELARYPEPLAPATAARRAGTAPVRPRDAIAAAAELARDHDTVLIEGAGGLLVRFDDDGGTLADVAAGLGAPALVVARAGLGTLNHTALTVEALRARSVRCAGVVIGSWPAQPDLAQRCNVVDLPAVTGVALLGVVPHGAGSRNPEDFLATARRSLGDGAEGTPETQ